METGAERCSFCGVPGDEEGVRLIASDWADERAAICDACVEVFFAEGHDLPMPLAGLAYRDAPVCSECDRWRPRCTLCGRLQGPGVSVVVASDGYGCCLDCEFAAARRGRERRGQRPETDEAYVRRRWLRGPTVGARAARGAAKYRSRNPAAYL